MGIHERINNIVTAFKHLNGNIRYFGEPMASDTPEVEVTLNGVCVRALGVAFNDLINGNLSLTINHPSFRHYPVCLKLHISRDGSLGWHDDFVQHKAEDAVGVGVTPEQVLDCIQEAVSTSLTLFMYDIRKDLRKIAL